MIPFSTTAISKSCAALAPALANHLWQSTLFAAVAALLTIALSHNQARTRYWLWLAASIKFLIPFSLFVAVGAHLAHPRATPQIAQPNMYFAMEEVSQPFERPALPVSPIAPSPAVPNVTHLIPALVAAIWLAGTLTVLSLWLFRWRRVAQNLRTATPILHGREFDALCRLQTLPRLSADRTRVQLLLSPATMEPGVFGMGLGLGHSAPILAWPANISDRLDDAHLEAILAHELAHVRRRDNLTAALHMLVEAIFWFHPLVWGIGARLLAERECACDEEVLLLGRQPSIYAEGILKVCEFCVESPVACVAGVTGADLKQRIVQIMSTRVVRRLDPGRKLLLLAAALLAVAVPVLAGRGKAMRNLASLIAAPTPFRTAAHAMIALEQTPSSGLIESKTETAQDAATDAADALGPAFEVAAIRPANRDDGRHWFGMKVDPSGRLTVSAETLSSLVWFSYVGFGTNGRVDGGPKWANTDEFDINAKVDEANMAGWDALSDKQRSERIKPMIRTLLAERFKLKLHTETRVTPVYAMVQVKGGAKLKEVDPPPAHVDPQAADDPGKKDKADDKPAPGSFMVSDKGWVAHAVQMQTLLGQIGYETGNQDRLVVDETGLKGYYDFAIKITHGADDATPEQQIEDGLGLKLEPRKMPIKTYIIDSAEKPSVDGAELPNPPTPTLTPVAFALQTPASPAPSIRFDVVSIKPSRQGELRVQDMPVDMPDGISTQVDTALDLIRAAYGPAKFPVNDRILGAPDWASQEGFDIQAKVSGPDLPTFQKLSFDQRRPMLQALLADRFKLKVHSETRQLPIYELVVGKDGAKLKEAGPDDARPNGLKDTHGQPLKFGFIKFLHPSEAVAQAMPMARLADLMSQPFLGIGRPVVDKTGLTSTYDFTLKWTPDQIPNGASPNDDSGPSIFTAIQEQLGLKLVPAKGPVEVLVIDQIEKPSPD